MIPPLLLTFWNEGWLEFPFFGGFFSISWWPSLHVHEFKDQQCHKFMPSIYYAVRCLLCTRSSGGCRAVAQHATIFSMRCRCAGWRRRVAGWRRRVAAWWTPKTIPGHGRPVIGALASLGGMGKQGVAIESGCCKSTGRVPVMELTEYESANEALVRAGHSEPRIWNKWNIVCDIVCDITYDMMQRTYDVWLKTYDESIRWEHTTSYVMTYDVVCLTDIVVSDIVGHDLRCRTYDVYYIVGHDLRCRTSHQYYTMS